MKPCSHQRNRVSHEILVACARNLPETLTAKDIDKEIARCIKVAPKERLCGMAPEQVEGLFDFYRRLGLLVRRVDYIREVVLLRRPCCPCSSEPLPLHSKPVSHRPAPAPQCTDTE